MKNVIAVASLLATFTLSAAAFAAPRPLAKPALKSAAHDPLSPKAFHNLEVQVSKNIGGVGQGQGADRGTLTIAFGTKGSVSHAGKVFELGKKYAAFDATSFQGFGSDELQQKGIVDRQTGKRVATTYNGVLQ
jgi:hypothetical protein